MLKIKIFLYICIESLFPFTIICSLKISTTNNLISVEAAKALQYLSTHTSHPSLTSFRQEHPVVLFACI
jgi:hypothetical protein